MLRNREPPSDFICVFTLNVRRSQHFQQIRHLARSMILDKTLELNDLIQSAIWHEPCLPPGVMAQKYQMEIAAMAHTQSLSLLPRHAHSSPFIELRQSLPSRVEVIFPFAEQLMRFILKFRSPDGTLKATPGSRAPEESRSRKRAHRWRESGHSRGLRTEEPRIRGPRLGVLQVQTLTMSASFTGSPVGLNLHWISFAS
jgi:hypothetical protein